MIIIHHFIKKFFRVVKVEGKAEWKTEVLCH